MSQLPGIGPFGEPFIELLTVDSTNNYARRLIQGEKLPEFQGEAVEGLAVFAHEQVAGKGQRGRQWGSEKEANIALSLLVKPGSLRISAPFPLSACAALAAYDFFSGLAGEATRIKWPNDLYWQDRKAGGVLIENSISASGNWEWAIIGTGININQVQFPPELPNPVSLRQITGESYVPAELARRLCHCFGLRYTQLLREGFAPLYRDYLQVLYKKGETVRFKKGNRLFDGLIKGVSPDGRLQVQHGFEEEFAFGEIEWRLGQG